VKGSIVGPFYLRRETPATGPPDRLARKREIRWTLQPLRHGRSKLLQEILQRFGKSGVAETYSFIFHGVQ
jgi:hypothetical protein